MLTACHSRYIIVEEVTSGRITSVTDTHSVVEVGDTVVVMLSSRSGTTLYGKYKGTLPKGATASSGIRYQYATAVRIK